MNRKNEDNLTAADIIAALKEEKVKPWEIAAELNIILNDHYSCGVESKDNKVMIKLLNGQRFVLSVKQAKIRRKL